MTKDDNATAQMSYQAPAAFVGLFYLILAAWVVFCLVFFETVSTRLGLSAWYGLIMIAFIICYTCYFALALSHRVEVWDDGRIRLTSFRRTIDVQAETIPYVEGPHLPIGFIRFRLSREKGYLFAVKYDRQLQKVLAKIHHLDPDIQFKNLKL